MIENVGVTNQKIVVFDEMSPKMWNTVILFSEITSQITGM